MNSLADQLSIIKRGVAELIPEDELLEKLRAGKPLKIKWGADPSAPDIHLGHTVVLHKLRQFQELGHKVVFIIGDFTAKIGDPTGKSETRKPLTEAEVASNASTYQEQIFKILDREMTEVVYNSHWLAPLKIDDVIKLAGKYTVARMLERDDFMNRFEKERPISIHEFLYPLIQGYDSVVVKADIEVGGTDQKFNMLVGRELQREYKEAPQVIITLPILEGTDGVQKMSKSLNNYIGITEPPKEIFGKVMSISDILMLRYYELLTTFSLDQVKALHPMEAKKQLASLLVERFYNVMEAQKARNDFESQFSNKEIPTDIESKSFQAKEISLITLLVEGKLAESNSEAKRLVQQGGVSVDGLVEKNDKAIISLEDEKLIKVGKRKFLRAAK